MSAVAAIIEVVAITEDHIESFHECLDRVARKRIYQAAQGWLDLAFVIANEKGELDRLRKRASEDKELEPLRGKPE